MGQRTIFRLNSVLMAKVILLLLIFPAVASVLLVAPASAETADVSSYITVTTANERSVLDRRTRMITSTVDVTLTNSSSETISGPLHAAIEIFDTDYSNVAMPDALGGFSINPYGKYYYDLSGRLLNSILASGQSVTFKATFVRFYTIRFRYNVIPFATVEGGPVNHAPTADIGGPYMAPVGQPIAFDGSGSSDPDGDPLDYAWDFGDGGSATGLNPSHTYVSAGTFTVTLTVADGKGGTDAASTEVTVVVGNEPPSLAPVADQTVDEGQPLTFQVRGSDPDSDALTYEATGLPSGATFTATGDPNVYIFSWTPDYNRAGDYTVSFRVSDPGGLEDWADILITVNNINRPPLLSPIGPQSVAEASLLSFEVAAEDPDGDGLSYQATGLPPGAVFDPSQKIFSWEPTYEQAGDYNAAFSVTDGDLSDSITVQITVSNVNRRPSMVVEPAQSVLEGSDLLFQVSGSDPDKDPLTFEASGLPAGANFNPDTATFSWTPTYEQSGIYPVLFSVTDGDLTASATVMITVEDVNRPPTITTAQLQAGRVDQIYRQQIVAQDPDGDVLTFSLISAPASMQIGAMSGEITWRPAVSEIGDHMIQVRVSDERGGTDSESYVIAVPDTIPPSLFLSAPSKGVPGATVTITATASDNFGLAAMEIDGLGENFSSFPKTGQKQKTVVLPAQLGPATFAARAWDLSGNTVSRTVSVEVAASFDTKPPEATLNAPKQVTPGETVMLTASVADNGSGVSSVTFFVNGQPIGNVTGPNPSITYTVPEGTQSPPVFTIQAVDNSGNTTSIQAPPPVITDTPDTTAPQASVAAPVTVKEKETLPVAVETTDNETGVARVDVYVNHTLVASFTEPPEGTFDIPLPPGVEPGMDALIEIVVTDHAGNETITSQMVSIEPAMPGVLAGEVYDDRTGLPLPGAEVYFIAEDGTTLSVTTNEQGQYSLTAYPGAGRLEITREGYTRVERVDLLVPENSGLEVFDSRLTPLAPFGPVVSATLAGKVTAPFSVITAGFKSVLHDMGLDPASIPEATIEVDIPLGALSEGRSFAVTQVSPQGLQGLLPPGWSPAGVVDIAPYGVAFQGEVLISLPNALGFDETEGLVLAGWEESTLAWRAVSTAEFSTDGSLLIGRVTSSGQYAFLVPDDPPYSPLQPAIGELLQGVTAGEIPEQVTTVVSPEPQIIFYRPGVYSDVGTKVTPQGTFLSSGTPVRAKITEEYEFYSGGKILLRPYVQDLVLYTLARFALTAGYPVTPSLEFEPLTLKQGIITVDVLAPSGEAQGLNIVGPEGGTIQGPAGEALRFPADAVSAPVPVDIAPLSREDLGFELPENLSYVGGISVSFSGWDLERPASLSIPLPEGFVAQGQLLLVRLLELEGATRLVLVGIGEVQDESIVSLHELSAEVNLQGILGEGRYFFVQTLTGTGFASGTVFDTAGIPLDGALVSSEGIPVVSLSGADGRYVSSVSVGSFTVAALDRIKRDSGSASSYLPEEGALVLLDISLQEEPPQVVSVSPEDGAENVPLASPLKIQFSEPLDASTVTPETLSLVGPEGSVAGTLSLSSSNTLVTFRPVDALSPNAVYTVTVTDGVRDMAGYGLAGGFSSSFASLDTLPPPSPPAGAVEATIPGEEGTTTITASQGTAGPHDTVSIVNKTKGISAPALVGADGSIQAKVSAGITDKVVISIKDQAGNETVVPIAYFRNPDGSTVIGPEGGQLEAENGVTLDIPAGTFPKGAIVKLVPLTKAEIGVDPGPDFPFVAGFEVECSESPSRYMNASAPAPDGTQEGKRGIVARRVSIYSGPVLSIVDTARVVDGRLTTSSPPCPGIVARIGRYGMFLNENQKMAMGEALLSMVAPADQSSVITPLIEGMAGQYSSWFPAYADVFKAVAYAAGSAASQEYAGEAYQEMYRQICMPVPANEPLKVVIRDADTGETRDVLDMDPISPGAHADISYRDADDKEPPAVTAVEPVHKVLDAFTREITIRFSEPIAPESAKKVVLVVQGENEQEYEGVFELRENNCLLRFLPSAPLPLGKNYRLDLKGVEDLAGNTFAGSPIVFFTFKPYTIFPTQEQRLDRNKIANDLNVSLESITQDLWFIDVDFMARPPEKSADGKWHTDLFAIQAGEGGSGQYRLFNINADDPTSPTVTGAFATAPRFFQRKVRILGDVHIVPRPEASGDPQFWKTRELHYRQDDFSNRVCGAPGSPEIAAWKAAQCEDPEDPRDCGVLLGGCGDLAVTIADSTKYGYLWSYDVTERNNVRWVSSRMLNDNGTSYGFPRYYEAPAGLGTPFGLEVLTGLDMTHGNLVHENTVGAYTANYGIGVELVDLGLNVPTINDGDRTPGSEDEWAQAEALKINAQLYYRDVAFVRGKAVAVAGQLGSGAGVKTLEIFRPDLAGEPLGMVDLSNRPTPYRLTTAMDVPLYGMAESQAVLFDLAFITSDQGGITIAEIPRELSAGSSSLLHTYVNTILTPQGVATKGIQVDRDAATAFVAASGVEEGVAGDHLLVVDVSRPFNPSLDKDKDGWDDRIVGKVAIKVPGYDGPVYVHGFRLDAERGLIYAGIYAGGTQALVVIKVRECPDLGVDFKAKPEPASLKSTLERKALEKVITTALSRCDSNGITMIEQGSGACIWKETGCGAAYQPFVSDHDYEVFFPQGTDPDTIRCVIDGLYAQVVNIESDPVPVEVEGYQVTFKDITFFPMVREEFEGATLNIQPPVGEQGDVTGDMGLGRQQLLLKWLVEGTYVDVPGLVLKGKAFGDIVAELRKPMDMDGDGTEDEPSRIPRLEGYEWAKFQHSEVYASGALIRILGASKVGTTLHQICRKELHKVAKAAIRAVLARIVADDAGNRIAVDFNADSPTCIEATDEDDPYAWPMVPCDSFEHHIASVAARLVRDYPELQLFTLDEVQDNVYRFYRVKAGIEEIITDEEADAFIAGALNFILEVGSSSGKAKEIYTQTIDKDPREEQRRINLAAVEDRIEALKPQGRKQIIPRVFNDGGSDVKEVPVRMYVGGLEKAKETVQLEAGEFVHLDTRKEPRPMPGDAPGTKRKNVPLFSLEANLEDSGQSGWVSFLADIPDKKVGEPDRENNWSKAFFYVLDRNDPSVPALPDEPGLDDVLGGSAQDLEDLLRPDPVCACLIPRTSAALTVGGSDRKILYIGGEVAVADLLVENQSDQAMKKVKIYSLDPEQGMVLLREIEEIAIGGSASATVIYFPGDQPGLEERQVFVEYTDEDGKVLGFGSNLLYLETQCPIALVALDPDPNPAASEVMEGGTFCRYYRVVDRSQNGQPVPDAAVNVRFLLGNGLVEREFKTDQEGDVITLSLTGDSTKGLCVPWDLWSAFPELPMDGAFPIKASANVDELWLMAEMPNACRAEPVTFDVALKSFEFEETFRAGASSSIEGSLVVAKGSLKDGSEIEMTLTGRKQAEQQAFDKLDMKRSESSAEAAKLGFMAGEFGVKTPFASCEVKVLSVSEELPLAVTVGDGYEFSLGAIGLGEADRIKAAGLYLDAILDAGSPSMATYAMMRRLDGLVENFLANKTSEVWGVSFAPSLNATLFDVNASAGIDQAKLSLDLSAAAGSSLYSSIETEDFIKESRKVRTIEFTGELNAKAGLELGLESVLSAGGDEDPVNVKATLIKEKDFLVGISGGWSRGMKLALTLNKTKALLPERLEVTFRGKKAYGYTFFDGGLTPLGDGEDFNITYSVSDLKDLLPVIRSMAEYGALLDAQRKTGMGLDPTLAVTIGPQRIYERLIEVLYLLKENATYSVVKEDGTSKEGTFGLGLKFLGVGLSAEDALKGDHLVKFVTEKGAFKGGLKYKLEDYAVDGFQDPTRGELEAILDQIGASVADRTRSAFEAVERNDDEMRIRTQNSSDLRLRNQTDYEAVQGPLSFNFEGRSGPFSPYHYAPGDIIGAADKPHYGIGGFHEFYPVGHTLTEPATLTIDYHEDEIQGLDEGSLAMYRWNSDLRDWEPVVGTLDAANNTVTAEINRLGAYTIGPAMPAGKVAWENRLVQEVGEGLRVSLTSAPLLMNNGAPVPDGTIFHVVSALPFAYTGEGLLAFGEVLSPDVLPELTGTQVRVQDARLQVVIEYPGNVSPGARIVIFSDAGTALGDEVVSLAP